MLGTAIHHATTNVSVASAHDAVTTVVDALRGRTLDSASVIAVLDGDRLAGEVTIERLLAAQPPATVADVMDSEPPTVARHTNQEHVAWQAVQHGEPGLAAWGSNAYGARSGNLALT